MTFSDALTVLRAELRHAPTCPAFGATQGKFVAGRFVPGLKTNVKCACEYAARAGQVSATLKGAPYDGGK